MVTRLATRLCTRSSLPRTTITRSLHSCTTVPPSPSAPRQLALPLAFLSVKGWDQQGLAGWSTWTRLAARAGYSSLLLELDPALVVSGAPSPQNATALLASLESELTTLLTRSSSPFPPLLFASGPCSLLAETYVSSHPLSGLFLHEPSLASSPPPPPPLKGVLPEFTYEPNFPLGVMTRARREFDHSRLGRLAKEEGEGWVQLVETAATEERDEQSWEQVIDWMDENGL